MSNFPLPRVFFELSDYFFPKIIFRVRLTRTSINLLFWYAPKVFDLFKLARVRATSSNCFLKTQFFKINTGFFNLMSGCIILHKNKFSVLFFGKKSTQGIKVLQSKFIYVSELNFISSGILIEPIISFFKMSAIS